MDVHSRFARSEESDGGTDAKAMDRLYTQLGREDLARHLAFFYRSPETQLKVAATFVRRGLRAGKRCLYFFDENTEERIRTALRSTGVDVSARLDAGDLLIRNGVDAYGESGFDPDALVSTLEDACHESVRDEYAGLWLAGEVSWCFRTDLAYDHVVDFEAAFEAACPDLPVTALCQYDLNRFNEESVAKALWTHRQILYRYTICENPYYIPPGEFRSGVTQPLNTQLMLEQMYDLARSRRQTESREQRLSVVNRILRHNIRNDLNVIRGIVDLVAESTALPDDQQERLSTAITHADDIVDIADKARYVDRTIEESVTERVDLGTVLADVRERLEGTYPDAAITVTGIEDASLTADRNLGTAFEELLLYAFQTQETTPPTVSLTIAEPEPEILHVDVRYPGGSIPETDREVLRQGAETQLDHCRGLGLWLAKWIVENSNGRIEFPESGDHQIRLEFHRASG